MGKIDLIDLLNKGGNINNTLRNYRFTLNEEYLDIVLSLLSEVNDERYVQYIYCQGGQTSSVFDVLESNKGENYQILWSGNSTPKISSFKTFLLKIISQFIPSCGGLLKMKNNQVIKGTMQAIGNLTMISLISIHKRECENFEKEFFLNIGNLDLSAEITASNFPSFFQFTIDNGNYYEELGGYLCTLSYGKDCYGNFLKIIDFTSNRW